MTTQLIDQNACLQMKQRANLSYTAYGLRTSSKSATPTLGYNGEHHDTLTQLYLFGNGYRPYSSPLMRFITPDAYSPFLLGGVNSYCYCGGDPINFSDPSGKTRTPLVPVNPLVPRYGGNPTLSASSRLRQLERRLRADARRARRYAMRDVRAALNLVPGESSRVAINDTTAVIHPPTFSAAADLNPERQRSALLASSTENWSLNLSLTNDADTVAQNRFSLLLTEYENVPSPQVNPPVIPAQINQGTAIQSLASSIRRTTVRGVNSPISTENPNAP